MDGRLKPTKPPASHGDVLGSVSQDACRICCCESDDLSIARVHGQNDQEKMVARKICHDESELEMRAEEATEETDGLGSSGIERQGVRVRESLLSALAASVLAIAKIG